MVDTPASAVDTAPPSIDPNLAAKPGASLFGPEHDAAAAAAEATPAAVPSADTAMATSLGEQKAQIAALTKQLEDMQTANMTLMANPQAPAIPLAPIVPVEADLPDPIDDAAGYATALADRITARVEAKMTAQQTAQQTQQAETTKYNDLWTAFQSSHKEYAGDQRKVRYAANIAAEELQKQGVDVEKYMFTYRDRFMDSVVGVMQDVFGEVKGAAPVVPEPQDPGRTAGMFGGLDSGGAPAEAAQDKPDADPFSDIREWQEKTGFHR